MTLHVAGRMIGSNLPTFVIAEIGVNHDGSVERAIELVDIAHRCGADAVKLQIFRADTLMHNSSGFAEYQKQRVADDDPRAMLRRYELSLDQCRTVVHAIRDRGMVPLATPFSPSDVDVIAGLGLPVIKIASPDLVNKVLLQRAATLGRPMFVSTGAATLAEVEACCAWMHQWNVRLALLHCVSSYPTPDDEAHLCWIDEMRRAFGVPVGYSDHTVGTPMSGALAVAAGACIIERHITYDRSAAGPDHSASSDLEQFAQYVKLVRQAERLRGMPSKRVLECEQDVRRVSRQSLVLVRSLRTGEMITQDHLTTQRPGTGICAAEVDAVIGCRATRPLPAGTMLQWDMLDDAA